MHKSSIKKKNKNLWAELHGKFIFSFPEPPKCFQHLF